MYEAWGKNMAATAHAKTLQELVFSCHVDPREQTQVVRLGNKQAHPLRHLANMIEHKIKIVAR